MKNENFFLIKLNAGRIIIVILLIFSLVMIFINLKMNSEIVNIKSDLAIKEGLIKRLKNRISSLESSIVDFESRINDLESER